MDAMVGLWSVFAIGLLDWHDGPATFDEFSDLIEEVRFARDSPLEQAGFEPPVPSDNDAHPAPAFMDAL
jgi:hypothetical protein